jgi:acetoin utilization deacetylase AcuC-like enzyme
LPQIQPRVQVLYAPSHTLHAPGALGALGGWRASRDTPLRIERMREVLSACAIQVQPVCFEHGLEPLARVHTPRYLEFLAGAHEAWKCVPGTSEDVHANVFAVRRYGSGYPESVVGRAAFHFHDQLAPIGPTTWQAARAAANLGIEAAERVRAGAPCVYAMCRPPGHHASADAAGGGTYLNNAALAAECLLQRWPRVAILDVDVHHGNGTQDIFWCRGDVFFASIRRDPVDYHPFFCGYADERGAGDGEGCNLNVPVAVGTTDVKYLEQLDRLLEPLMAFDPKAIVVSLGLDAHAEDPAAGLKLSDDAFTGIGQRIAALGLPTVMFQEGGYNSAVVSGSLLAVLNAWR